MILILTQKNTFWCCAYVDPSTHSWSGSKTDQPQVTCLGIYIKGQNSFEILLFVGIVLGYSITGSSIEMCMCIFMNYKL